MSLDLRTPIGLLFALYGALLTVYGVGRTPALKVDVIWGLVLLAFGSSLLVCRLWREIGRRAP